MRKPYVITEGPTDAVILEAVLPESLVEETRFVPGSGRYFAQSLASSILAVRGMPVALVVDADTTDEASILVKGLIRFLSSLAMVDWFQEREEKAAERVPLRVRDGGERYTTGDVRALLQDAFPDAAPDDVEAALQEIERGM